MPGARRCDKRWVRVYRAAGLSEDLRSWEGKPLSVRAVIKPISSMLNRYQLGAEQWGRTLEGMLAMYCYEGREKLAKGHGAMIYNGDAPDFEIVGLEPWSGYTLAYLAYIPAPRQKAPGGAQ